MKEFKKLFQAKRMLAMILAVAMVATMLPETTYAATVTDSIPEQSEETEILDVADTEESSVIDAETEATQETIETEESSSVEETGEDTASQPETDGEESAVLQAEISINETQLESKAKEAGFVYDTTTKKVIATYDVEKENPFGDFLSNSIKTSVVSISAGDSTTNTALKEHLSYKWQAKGADGNYTDMAAGEAPANTGEYKLVISLDASLAIAESKEINFEIEKAVLAVSTEDFNPVKTSGITVKEIKEEITEAVKIASVNSAGTYTYSAELKSYIKPLAITVRESLKTEALADETVLIKTNDYSVDIVAELADEYKAYYELEQCGVVDLKIKELKKTTLTITNNVLSTEQDITRTYNGNPVAEPTVTGDTPEIAVQVTVDGEIDETTGEAKVLPVDYAQLTKTWLDAEGNKLESAPVDAGLYYFEIKYTDTTGVYTEASDKVKVIVEPAKIILKPSLSVKEYFTGMSAQDVTVNVTYTLETTDGKKFEFDPDTFWGVSYNNPDAPQSYAPVFKLQKGQTTTAADGTTNTEWTDVTGEIDDASGIKEIETEDGKKEVTISYRVVFKGTKALFVNGTATEELDANDTYVNSAEKNYVADTTTDVTEANAIAVTVNASANATIDVSAMLIDGMQEESISAEDKIYSKVYDGTQLYKDRADYKKAVLKDENGKALTGEADSLIYTWYTAEIQEETDEEGKVIKKPVLEDECITYYDTTPVNSGLYALQVSYADAEHEYVAEPVCLYFRIDKQLLKVIPEGTPEAYDGTSISDFIDNKTDNIDYKIYKIPGNDLTLTKDQLVEVPELAKGMSDLCYLRWFVMKGDNTNADIAEYTEVSSGYFKLGIPYKAGAKIVFNYSSYVMDYNRTNYSDNYTVIVEEKEQTEYTSETVPIVIKPMGTTELEISIDSSKLTTTEKVYDGKEFDISNDVANGLITVRKKNTDEMVPVTGDGAIALTYIWRYNGSYVAEKPINARTYTLYVKFEGNDNYQNTNEIIVGTFTITSRELTVTPVLHDTITAGLNVSSIENIEKVIDNSKVEITGYIEEDAEAFAYTDSIEEAKALQDVVPYVADADGNRYTSYLRTGKEYTAGYRTYYYNQLYLNASALKDGYTGNYKIVVTTVKFRTNKRGNSTVTAVNYNSIDTTRLKVTYEDLAVTVKPVEGIPYSYNAVVDENGDKLDGNYFVFEIDRPTEFCYDSNYSMKNNAVYKNSIEKAGGYVLNEGDSYIKVAFDATAPETGDNIRTFVIRWEDGYVESFTVDFTDAELESDLTAAVAPKTLAFNAVDSKMFVGECQQLDVKMTKHLVDDIICLNYGW